MSKNVRFYICEECDNTIGLIHGDPEKITCCGKKMKLLEAKESGEKNETHIPAYKKEGNELIVNVGSIPHPMEEDHNIMWVALVGENETTRIRFKPNQKTEVRLKYIPDSTLYAYCNKHGLWKTDVE